MKVVCVSIPGSVNSMPDEILCMIFDRIDFPEKFKLRGVCHQWKTVLEDWLAGRQYVRLKFKEPDAACGQAHCAKCEKKGVVATVRSACQYPNCDNCQKAIQANTNQYRPKMPTCTEWSPKPSVRALEFAQSWVEPQVPVTSITIRHLNPVAMATAFGSLFANLQVLVIYFDMQDTQQNVANIVQLLSNCTKLATFAFIMSTDAENETTLPAICEALNKPTMPKLNRLDLFVSDFVAKRCSHAYHPSVDLSNCGSRLAHFGMTFCSIDYLDMMKMISVENGTIRGESSSAANHALTSLCIPVRFQGINDLLEVNPEFRHVKRIQLYRFRYTTTREMAANSLFQFWRVESLLLAYWEPKHPNPEIFDEFWIVTLGQLIRLTELTLIDFALPGLARIVPPPRVPTHAYLPKVKKLTIGAADLLTRFKEHCENGIVDVDYFGYIINRIFPRLEEITVLAGESHNMETFDDECLNTLSGRMVKVLGEKCPAIKKITVELGNEALVNSFILYEKNRKRIRENWHAIGKSD